MKKILLFVLLMFVSFAGIAQEGLPPAYDVSAIKNEVKWKLPSEYWQVFSLGGDTILSLKEVTSAKHSGKFAFNTFNISNNDPDEMEVVSIMQNVAVKSKWVRFRLKNSSAVDKSILVTCNGGMDTYYIYQEGKWKTHKTGKLIPWGERDGNVNENQVYINVKPKSEVVVYVDSRLTSALPKISDFKAFVEQEYTRKLTFDDETIVDFGFAGFIAFAMIFNLLFYYVNREKLYLNYSIMLFFIALFSSWETAMQLWFPWAAQFKVEMYIIVVGGFVISFINTFQLFLDIRNYYPKWSIFLKYFIWSAVVYVFLTVVVVIDVRPDFGRSMAMLSIIGMLFTVVVLSFIVSLFAFAIILIRTLWKLKKRKDPEAQITFWALVPYFLTYLPFIPSYRLLAAMWGVSMLSWAMFARFKRLREENVAQVLEKERMTREKEEEKNALIAEQNARLEQLVEERTAELEQSLENLKETQNQLIQSEKMASLGELTAGIAHEIQNPLNFVNNFSDVSVELLEEMEEELEKGDIDEVKAITADVKQNLEKIAHHGRRADSIVKGMLQHSRASSGQKEPTDINALADEYLRLAYHGLRAKDKTFNAELITDFDSSLPKIEILPQDLGRVLLNLFTNAFYATQQKVKQYSVISDQSQLTDGGYKPAVSVTTRLIGNSIEIRVKDNGTGIPDAIKDKILQPFFTTKPTGEGTGLGLSLSYDIVVKAHGGTIEIESVQGEGAVFIITLPL